jgi:uncharacterized membrane protein
LAEIIVIWGWLEFALRWLHVITAIAWIGSSFYFIALDLGLQKNNKLSPGVQGEEWQVHGGGFYHIRKYSVAPNQVPEHLTWFKWESYSTWLSGFALMVVIYWVGGELYLIDSAKSDLELWQGIIISAASLLIGWFIYDFLCKSRFRNNPSLLMVVLFFILVVMGWSYNQIFTGRAVFLHLGAFTATIMTANVFLVIIPNQKIVVDDLFAKRTPNPEFGKIAKLRSTHNNYLTLPVIFLMLSNHYPLAFASEWNWVIAALVFLMGVTIRHYFNTIHARAGNPIWAWPVTIIIFILIMWLSMAPAMISEKEAARINEKQVTFESVEEFSETVDIVVSRCSMCHAREPVWEGVNWAPGDVYLETPNDITKNAKLIYLHSAISYAMPPANITYMEDHERAILKRWFRSTVNGMSFAEALK